MIQVKKKVKFQSEVSCASGQEKSPPVVEEPPTITLLYPGEMVYPDEVFCFGRTVFRETVPTVVVAVPGVTGVVVPPGCIYPGCCVYPDEVLYPNG